MFFGFIFFLFVILLLAVYWFIPFSSTEFTSVSDPNNFNLDINADSGKQFYENMRFSESKISYSITDCTISKKDEMLRAFSIIEDRTLLTFYESSNPLIEVTCESKNRIEGGLFIAGEGGPTNITKSGIFNVISSGKILLLRESNCETPNVAIHELLHVLGFDHVSEQGNIMYPISSCGQEIRDATISKINSLYSIPSEPDLLFEEVTASMGGRYLDTNFSIRNNGLANSGEASIRIYADDSLIKEITLDPLAVGNGRIITFTNIWISKLKVEALTYIIESNFNELKKENNEARLSIKK